VPDGLLRSDHTLSAVQAGGSDKANGTVTAGEDIARSSSRFAIPSVEVDGEPHETLLGDRNVAVVVEPTCEPKAPATR
jgi:hypothetical protein